MCSRSADWSTLQEALNHLTPAEKVELIEATAQSLRAQAGEAQAEQRREALDRVRRELAELPLNNAADGFSNRNHDEELYGGAS